MSGSTAQHGDWNPVGPAHHSVPPPSRARPPALPGTGTTQVTGALAAALVQGHRGDALQRRSCASQSWLVQEQVWAGGGGKEEGTQRVGGPVCVPTWGGVVDMGCGH